MAVVDGAPAARCRLRPDRSSLLLAGQAAAQARPAIPGLRPGADLRLRRRRPRRPAVARRVPGLPALLASHEGRRGHDRADVPPARHGSRRVPLAAGIPQVASRRGPAARPRRPTPRRRSRRPRRPGADHDPGPITPEQEKFFEAKIRPVLGDAMRQVPREHRREAAGRARLDSREGLRLGRRLGPGDRARQPRGKPADPGDPLPRRGASDAPQGEARRRGRRRLRGLGQDGWRPTRRTGPAAASRRVRRSISRRGGSSGRSGRRRSRPAGR